MGLYDDAVALARDNFVGREGEISRFRSLLDGSEARVWWVFGPGGIGKSRLLSVLADDARAAGCRVVAANVRSGDELTLELTSEVIDGVGSDHDGRTVMVLDGLEPMRTTATWLRCDLLPRLPSQSLVVIGSRHAPSLEWRSDPAWSTLLELIPVRGLSTIDGERLLSLAGVSPELVPKAMELGRGHPLALQLLADAFAGRSVNTVPNGIGQAPDLVAVMLTRLIDEVPDDQHRLAIELASLARVTTRSMLRDCSDPSDADHRFEWLAGQPWVDRVADGLRPHDLAREVIEADLRGNDPDRYASARRAVRKHVLDPQRVSQDPDRCATDYLYLLRWESAIRSAWDWSSFGQSDVTGVEDCDRDVLADLVADSYGPASVPVLDHWLGRQPQGFAVLRSSEGVVGFITTLFVDEPTDDDLAADPSMAAIWRRALRRGRPRPGEGIGLFRFVCDRKAGTLPPSPTYNAVTVRGVRHWLTTPGLSLDYVVKPRGGSFKPMMDMIDFHPVTDADHAVGDVDMVVFEHDWREAPLPEWLDRMEVLETGGQLPPAVGEAPVLIMLEEDAFAEAVRAALRDVTRSDRLVANPLVASRVVRDGRVGDGPEAVVETLRAAFAALDDHPRTERARRAVDRTYLRGAVTQEAAAEVLGMAFSTYRRHLASGIDLLIERLWRWELYGRND